MTPPDARQPSDQDRARAAAGAVNRPLVYHVAGEEQVRITRDVMYRTGPDARADIYAPLRASQGTRAPIVILLHGGVPKVPVLPKDWGFFQGWGRLLAASGFGAVTFNHRLGYPKPFMSEAADDLEQLMGYVRRHAGEFGGDPGRIALFAFSAGGPLLAPYIGGAHPDVRALVAFYCILDIRESEAHRQFMKAEELAAYSPAARVEAHASAMPPMFVMGAGQDQVPGLKRSMEAFLDAAIRKNAPITLMIHPTGVHGFDNTNDGERSREIMKSTIEFLHAHLGPAPGQEESAPAQNG